MATEVSSERAVTFRTVVIEALLRAENDKAAATEILTARLRSDAELLNQLLGEIIRTAFGEIAREVFSKQRSIVRGDRWTDETVPPLDAQVNASTLAGYAAVAMDSLLNYPLRGGLILGMATGPELDAESSWRFKSARTQFVDAKWLRAIRAQLPNDTTRVNVVLTNTMLHTLLEQAKGKKPAVAA